MGVIVLKDPSAHLDNVSFVTGSDSWAVTATQDNPFVEMKMTTFSVQGAETTPNVGGKVIPIVTKIPDDASNAPKREGRWRWSRTGVHNPKDVSTGNVFKRASHSVLPSLDAAVNVIHLETPMNGIRVWWMAMRPSAWMERVVDATIISNANFTPTLARIASAIDVSHATHWMMRVVMDPR